MKLVNSGWYSSFSFFGRATVWPACILLAFLASFGSASAADISGTISTTLTIMENSRLVGDVTCTVTGAPCIAFGAPGLTLDLNGFSLTGLADPQIGCSGDPTLPNPNLPPENGITIDTQKGATIQGPGLVQQFRNAGIFLNNSTGVTVTGVTSSTNCLSGILVGGGSEHDLNGNILVRNANKTYPCGGI
jgi:hypothetical protein